jgi:hypothetical protein
MSTSSESSEGILLVPGIVITNKHYHAIQLYINEPDPFGDFGYTLSPYPHTGNLGGGTGEMSLGELELFSFSGYVRLLTNQSITIEKDRVEYGQVDNLEACLKIRVWDVILEIPPEAIL